MIPPHRYVWQHCTHFWNDSAAHTARAQGACAGIYEGKLLNQDFASTARALLVNAVRRAPREKIEVWTMDIGGCIGVPSVWLLNRLWVVWKGEWRDIYTQAGVEVGDMGEVHRVVP